MSEQMCYVGLRECGCIRAAAVDNPEYKKETAKVVAKWLKDGLTIERWAADKVRLANWKCTHERAR